MMECPECKKTMIHSNDEQNENGLTWSLFNCKECKIDVLKYWDEEEGDSSDQEND